MATTASDPDNAPGRAMCYRCFRPERFCLCGDVAMVDNRTGVIVVQHVRERNHPFGTARLAKLGLRRAEIRVCGPKDEASMARASALPPGTALLYPSTEARDVETLSPDERPTHIVVVDATWHQAKTIVREAPWLQALPRIRLTPSAASAYRIRRQPRPECLSTIEATVALLRALEPDTPGLDGLIGSFRRMIDRQLEERRQLPTPRQKKQRASRARVPQGFVRGYERLVVVYGDVLTSPGAPAEVVYWCALRPATGETFARFVRPARAALNPLHLELMGLSAAQIAGGVSHAQFREAWRTFLRPTDVVVAWNRRNLDAAAPATDAPAGRLLLKGAACNLLGRSCGHLEDFVHTLGLDPRPTPFEGRAGEHLGNALALVEHMRALGGS